MFLHIYALCLFAAYPATPPQPEYINFPNMAAKEKDHRNALARAEHSADRANIVNQREEIDKERKLVISSISKDTSIELQAH